MRITHIHDIPSRELTAVRVASGSKHTEHVPVEVYEGTIEGLPETIDAMVVTSDLQAYDSEDKAVEDRVPLGEVLARTLPTWSREGFLPSLDRLGVILAGDLFARPELDVRGGFGEVTPIWLHMAEICRWVVGVSGNHDMFHDRYDLDAFDPPPNCHPLHHEHALVDTIRFAGISGMLSPHTHRPWRQLPADWRTNADRLLEDEMDMLILHHGPKGLDERYRGHGAVNAFLETVEKELLVVCGHRHWPTRTQQLSEHVQVLNTDYAVVVLRRP